MAQKRTLARERSTMSSDEKIEGFLGCVFTLGKNMKVLINGKTYFAEQGTNITSYGSMVDTFVEIGSEDVPPCAICHEGISAKRSIDGETIETTTRMMMFIDEKGGKHYTHYRLMSCFKKVDFKPRELSFDNQSNALGFVDREDDFVEFDPPPSYPEFLGCDRENRLEFIRAERSYNQLVKPFIAKWQPKQVSKANLLEFLDDWQHMGEHALLFVEDELTAAQFLRKVQRLIGVK